MYRGMRVGAKFHHEAFMHPLPQLRPGYGLCRPIYQPELTHRLAEWRAVPVLRADRRVKKLVGQIAEHLIRIRFQRADEDFDRTVG